MEVHSGHRGSPALAPPGLQRLLRSLQCPLLFSAPQLGPDFYDQIENQIGGGKPKMRWYFKEQGWPLSTIFEKPLEDDEDRAKIIDTLQDRFQGPDCFLAGDDVKEKKPDPSIYITCSCQETRYLSKGLFGRGGQCYWASATRAGMSSVISYTSSTADQDFKDAVAIYPDLSNKRLKNLELLLQNAVITN